MERSIWKGSITFGLVEIPVALVSAERPNDIKLSFLDRRDFSPVGYNRYNKTTGEEVAWADIVHGFEYEKGQHVVLTKKDLRQANPELTQTVNIVQFVDAAEIEPIYYEKPYYLEPLQKSKGYVLLRETLKRTGKLGVATVVLRTRENVAAIGVRGKALVLYLLRFHDEVRPPDELENVQFGLREVGVQPKEVQMAARLIEDMTAKWDPEAYVDRYRDDLMQMIEAKVESGDVHAIDDDVDEDEVEAPEKGGEIIDLMPLLKRSIESARNAESSRRAKPRVARTGKATRRSPSVKKRTPRRHSA